MEEWKLAVWQHLQTICAFHDGDIVCFQEVMRFCRQVFMVMACLEWVSTCVSRFREKQDVRKALQGNNFGRHLDAMHSFQS